MNWRRNFRSSAMLTFLASSMLAFKLRSIKSLSCLQCNTELDFYSTPKDWWWNYEEEKNQFKNRTLLKGQTVMNRIYFTFHFRFDQHVQRQTCKLNKKNFWLWKHEEKKCVHANLKSLISIIWFRFLHTCYSICNYSHSHQRAIDGSAFNLSSLMPANAPEGNRLPTDHKWCKFQTRS